VERQIKKAASALLLSDHIGESFDALVTGASAKATWVDAAAAGGRARRGREPGLDVGDAVRVRLVRADPARARSISRGTTGAAGETS